ncbi:MAG: DNA-binding transcriptional LysR family regulator [Oceanicoccus sp.]|jgi:DNA-binding transcriptional LysR family regulator
MDKLKTMRYFCRIDETGSFSGAARLAAVPVSTLSRSIQALELELGAELLRRSTRHVVLTEIGKIYLDHCKDIIAAIDRAEGQVGSYQSSPSGVLRISALPLYAEVRLLPILEELQASYPDIVIDLDFSNQVADLSRDGIDIAIRGGSIPDERVIAQYIDDNTPLLCASTEYLEKYGVPETVADLSNHKAILYRAPGKVLYWQVEVGGNWSSVEIKTALISNGGRMLQDALLAGKGMGLFPRWCMEDALAKGDIALVPLPGKISTSPSPTTGIYLLYQRPQYVIPKIKVAVDFLRARLQTI